MNRLQRLVAQGQSVWLDYIRRSFITSGELRRLIDEDGLSGVTSNPAIFDEAMSKGAEYDDAIKEAAGRVDSADAVYRSLAIADVQLAADHLKKVFDRTEGADGYVSLEVSPHLAHLTLDSVRQAREFWQAVDRPNLFVKIPATEAGLGAIRQLIAEGINVNVTLLFGLPRYRAVAEAFMAGLEDRLGAGKPIARVASVASFFLSRIDLVVDPKLEEIAQREGGDAARRAQRLRGQAAIASAKQAYQIYKELRDGERFRRLAAAGARPQRVLWASTSTKTPGERDVRYVEALIGPETINTMPRKTLDAFRDHGDPTARLEHDLDDVRAVLRELGEIGISLDAVSRQLEGEGIVKFAEPFDHLLGELQRKVAGKTGEKVARNVAAHGG